MARPLLDVTSKLQRPEQQRYAACAVPGCGRTPRSFSRFCTMHARTLHRTRDPNGRAVRVSEIKPYLQLADLYLQKTASHPAVKASEDFLRISLNDSTLPAEIRKQMQRLRFDGVTPRTMLTNFLGVWGLQHYLPHTVTSDACIAFNIGNRVLRSSPLPTFTTPEGRRNPTRLPARVCEGYGLLLRNTLGAFASQFWRHVQRDLDAPTRAARAVADALRESPLSETNQSQTS